MRRDHHVGGFAFERHVDDAGIVLLQAVGIEPALARLLQLDLRAQIGPGGVVELQITATGVVEAANRLPIGLGQILEYGIAILVFLDRDCIRLEAEMHRRRTRYAHFRRRPRMGLEKLEMVEHRMMRKAEFAVNTNAARLGLHALELDAVIEFVDLDAVEHPVKIEMPP